MQRRRLLGALLELALVRARVGARRDFVETRALEGAVGGAQGAEVVLRGVRVRGEEFCGWGVSWMFRLA